MAYGTANGVLRETTGSIGNLAGTAGAAWCAHIDNRMAQARADDAAMAAEIHANTQRILNQRNRQQANTIVAQCDAALTAACEADEMAAVLGRQLREARKENQVLAVRVAALTQLLVEAKLHARA